MANISGYFDLTPITIVAGTTILLVLALTGCASESGKRVTYDVLYQRACIERTGTLNCDPEHKDYDRYKKEREELLKAQPGK